MTTSSKLRQNAQKYSIFLILIAMFIICSILSPYFLTSNNLINILRQTCVGLLIAYGEMILIIAGFLDLSVASVLALTGVLAVDTYRHTQSLAAALAVAIVVGILCNLFNAFFVAQFDVPAFIATLGMQEIARGIALYYCGGSNILQLGDFVVLGQGTVGPIPIPVIIVFVISIIIWYLVNETRWGRSLYAIGGNREAATAAGINVKLMTLFTYLYMGVCTAFAGIMLAARTNSGQPTAGNAYEFDAIIACVLGGCGMAGGVGSAAGSLIGALTIGVINNCMNLVGVSPYYQSIVKGIIIVLAVLLDKKTHDAVMKAS